MSLAGEDALRALARAFELQPTLAGERLRLRPLAADDFEPLYAVAADPLIWEQHPTPTRYQRGVFANYFAGAMASGGALLIIDQASGAPMGSSRYYDYDAAGPRVAIGYTFIARQYWGRGYNRELKQLMLDHAFRSVHQVVFHVGRDNRRSRIAMQRLGATLAGEAQVAYVGEASHVNVIYTLERADWLARP
jgi:RimJ/RimL family protein N-acetyltransferase